MAQAHIHITGIVQGVGMRPFVYREATARGIGGWVLNAGDGVHIEAHASSERELSAFVAALRANAPAAARVDGIEVRRIDSEGAGAREAAGACKMTGTCNAIDTFAAAGTCEMAGTSGSIGACEAPAAPPAPAAFRIIASNDDVARTTLVSPDIATCPDCLRELFDPANRRYHYPFINCTACGPRFTIIRALPYDRAQTSMSAFSLCPECAAEYADPLDRRFHAQPDACFACGPHLIWRERGDDAARRGDDLAASDAIIGRCADLIAAGAIVAIKGLGGFHLACDAGNDEAVRTLRARKRRSNKPLAVMMRSCAEVEAVCAVNDVERDLLEGTARPIVLLRRRLGPRAGGASFIAPSVVLDLPELGVMLPYTPLQHLLLDACATRDVRALVMTSGNLSEEPIEIDDAEAWEHLVETGIADALLGNDREILTRFDDSVVRVVDGVARPVRRARGYAPRPLVLPEQGEALRACAAPVILACGPEQKATVALARVGSDGGAECLLSPHIGDLENASTLDAWHAACVRLETLFGVEPAAIACDLHPSYLSSQWARAEASARDVPLIEVQHHHAHIASVLAEAIACGDAAPDKPVVGIALDGTGAGTDGTIWGGEILVVTRTGFERAGHLKPWPLPGGAAAVRDARRTAYGLLRACGLLDHPGARGLLDQLSTEERSLMDAMIDQGINSPATSSMGRLLDALAALAGICSRATYEGEPAILLEAAAWGHGGMETRPDERDRAAGEVPDSYRLAITATAPLAPDAAMSDRRARVHERAARSCYLLDPTPLARAVLDDVHAGRDHDVIADDVHQGVARSIVDAAALIAREHGCGAVALSGGVFLNRLLLSQVTTRLRAHGLRVLVPRDIPVNDGCIAYGQAAVACARLW